MVCQIGSLAVCDIWVKCRDEKTDHDADKALIWGFAVQVGENIKAGCCGTDCDPGVWQDVESRNRSEGRELRFAGPLLFYFYGLFRREIVRRFLRRLVLKAEGGVLYSVTIRRILLAYHGVEVGMYSGMNMLRPGNFKNGTRVGRYSAIYETVRAFDANHPTNTKSTHAFFYNPALGHVDTDALKRTRLTIGSDVWMGHAVILLPAVTSVGDGAVIGAGAVVSQDIPPYAVVVGNPARVIRYRFSPSTIKAMLAEQWWEKSLEEVKCDLDSFCRPLEDSDRIR